LLKVALNTIKQTNKQTYSYVLISAYIFMSHNCKLVPRVWITQSLYVIMK
jgi:hypothetical protein